MGSDVPRARFQPMRSPYLSVRVYRSDEVERINSLLSDGDEIFIPMAETFFAFCFSVLRDKLGKSWMINYPRPMPPNAGGPQDANRTRDSVGSLLPESREFARHRGRWPNC
jgi:hypothetical protein